MQMSAITSSLVLVNLISQDGGSIYAVILKVTGVQTLLSISALSPHALLHIEDRWGYVPLLHLI